MDVERRERAGGDAAAHRREPAQARQPLTAQALASEADVKAALPAGFGVQLLRSEGGEVEVQATGALFGVGASVNAVARSERTASWSRTRSASCSKRCS